MSSSNLRENAVIATLVMVILYGLAALVWFTKMNIANRNGEWYKARKAYQQKCRQYREECRLISQTDEWAEKYDAEKAAMPTFAEGMATDTTYLGKIGEIAAKHHIEIGSRQPGKEVTADDVLELSIDCQWEGSLESLVKFMYELENTDEGMFDIASLNFKPSAKRGYLKGSFTVTCAYMRE